MFKHALANVTLGMLIGFGVSTGIMRGRGSP